MQAVEPSQANYILVIVSNSLNFLSPNVLSPKFKRKNQASLDMLNVV